MTPILLKRLRYRLREGRWPEPERLATRAAGARFAQALSRLGPGDVAIDAGANVGDFTERMAATGAPVHAFEPDPWSMERLRRRFLPAGRTSPCIRPRSATPTGP